MTQALTVYLITRLLEAAVREGKDIRGGVVKLDILSVLVAKTASNGGKEPWGKDWVEIRRIPLGGRLRGAGAGSSGGLFPLDKIAVKRDMEETRQGCRSRGLNLILTLTLTTKPD